MSQPKVVGPLDLADIIEVWTLHQRFPTKTAGAYRRFDGTTPAAMHSLAAASILSLETDVPPELRYLGQQVLVRHDAIEDTVPGLPADTPSAVRELVELMSFEGGFSDEKVRIWERPPIVWWLKLYDKFPNLADGANRHGWMESRGQAYRNEYVRYTHQLLDAVEKRKADIFPERPDVTLLVSGMIRGCFPLTSPSCQ